MEEKCDAEPDQILNKSGPDFGSELATNDESLFSLSCLGTMPSEAEFNGSDDITSQVMAINKRLKQQIEALRLRLEVDHKHHDQQCQALVSESNDKLCAKLHHISDLQTKLEGKEQILDDLEGENETKTGEIKVLQQQIEELRKDVQIASAYTDQLQTGVSLLQSDRGKLKTGSAYKEKDEAIRSLQIEVESLKQNLVKLDNQLAKTKELIAQQGVRLRLFENNKVNLELKFKDDLKRLTSTVRLEIEKLRDVIRIQWVGMKALREQNETMRSDIKEIRELVVASQSNVARSVLPKGTSFPKPTVSKSTFLLKKDTKRGQQVNKKFH